MMTLLKNNAAKILTVFSLSPGSRLNRKTLQEKTKMNNIILDKTINQLVNFNFLSKDKNFFLLNFKNKETRDILKIISEDYNKLKQMPLYSYFMILDIFEEISKIKNIGNVYLFGSYSKLIFKENSDIDFAVVSEKVNKKEVNKTIQKLEKRFNKKIEMHFFTKEFYKNKKDPLVKEIIQQGVKLN
ncbi:MAG: hypothetical protein QT10_C0017G0015 [archaeon GW2011_AR19]|nr:MAG: hypothetical protein QT10_C0017G0015 [archaeon GW2011_AR19]